jgi:hypothetical protein
MKFAGEFVLIYLCAGTTSRVFGMIRGRITVDIDIISCFGPRNSNNTADVTSAHKQWFQPRHSRNRAS